MQTHIPEAGKTYTSKADPNVTVYVEAVHVDDEDPASFLVETCDPADKDNMSAMGVEYDAEEWQELRFTETPRPS